LRQIGIWSFSIYLWQQPFYVAVRHGDLSPSLGLPMAAICRRCLLLFHRTTRAGIPEQEVGLFARRPHLTLSKEPLLSSTFCIHVLDTLLNFTAGDLWAFDHTFDD
jgi:hypothetical protein